MYVVALYRAAFTSFGTLGTRLIGAPSDVPKFECHVWKNVEVIFES